MKITGQNLVAGQWLGNSNHDCFSAYLPATDSYDDTAFCIATNDELDMAVSAAKTAFVVYRKKRQHEKAEFLRTIANEVAKQEALLLATTARETVYNRVRLQGEFARTLNQLRLFAEALETGGIEDIVEQADANRRPVAKPATRLTHIPLGTVAVFGASNFPYAFSTLGGDTVSALAAGCPVVVKAHPAHPITCEIMARAISKAIDTCNMPVGVFSQLHSPTPALSHELVVHPDIKAVGFTGSLKVAQLLQQTIAQREHPIPFYGELGSTNPQFILPEKAREAGSELAEQLCDSLLLGHGQFSTSPGIWFVPVKAIEFLASAKEYLANKPAHPMLSKGIAQSYEEDINAIGLNSTLTRWASGDKKESHFTEATLFITNMASFLNNKQLHKEVFGPCAIIVTYEQSEELEAYVETMDGQLTACVHGSKADLYEHADLSESLSYKVGRLIYNQMPTGVEICASMNHGGPFPASTDVRSTSVGQQALRRFLRPLCVQNQPVESV
ncbi:MAG: aldehyde dehydrogenase family protein [Alteromonadaceae bacterium]|nr:aldehyde dehydrogenase family protein [Alteromonadaceae bacterium]